MGQRPARIVGTLDIDRPRPRGDGSFADQRFTALQTRLRALLAAGHGQVRSIE
jgi:hypothetical protein